MFLIVAGDRRDSICFEMVLDPTGSADPMWSSMMNRRTCAPRSSIFAKVKPFIPKG